MLRKGFLTLLLAFAALTACGQPTNNSTAGQSTTTTQNTTTSQNTQPTTASGATTDAAGAPTATFPSRPTTSTGGATGSSKQYSAQPPMTVDKAKKYTAVIDTSKGKMTAELYVQDAPVTVNNFVFLAREGFYKNVKFHRIIKGFMVQTGDPLGNGTGGPGYEFQDEPVTRDYKRGTLAMANAGPNTNGSQFFIVHADYPLPKNYTIFGQVTDGLETLDAIANTPVTVANGEASAPTEEVRINDVTITEQ